MSKAKLLVLLLLSGYTMVSYGGNCAPGSGEDDVGSTKVTIINNMNGTLYYGGENSGGDIHFTGWSGPDPAPLIKSGASADMLFCSKNGNSGANITVEAPKGKSIGTISFSTTTSSNLTSTSTKLTTCSTTVANSTCTRNTQVLDGGHVMYCECQINNP